MFLFIRGSTNPGPRVSRLINYFDSNSKRVVYLAPHRTGDVVNDEYRDLGSLGEYDYFDGSGFRRYIVFLFSVNYSIVRKILNYRKDIKLVHFSDLEVTLFGAFACKLFGIRFIYNIHDNFFQRYDINASVSTVLKYIEAGYIYLSFKTLVPELFRKTSYSKFVHKKIEVLRNYPDFDVSTNYLPFQSDTIKLFYGGWISKNRSIDHYFELALELRKKGCDVKFELCGWGDETYLDNLECKFLEHDIRFKYLGQLSHRDSIKYLQNSDISIAFYNPNKVINILAASNKIPEIIGSSTVLITNEQTEIAKILRPMNISLQFEHDVSEVIGDLMRLINNKDEILEFVGRTSKFYSTEYSPKQLSNSIETLFHEFV
jgi:glycosyltransferase involved in cell wall biosynthesis